jgi:hypothetical protein
MKTSRLSGWSSCLMLERTRDSRAASVTQDLLDHSKTIMDSTLIQAKIASFHTSPNSTTTNHYDNRSYITSKTEKALLNKEGDERNKCIPKRGDAF